MKNNQRYTSCQNHWIIAKAREFQKNIYPCFIDYTKAFDCMNHKKLYKALKEMEILDHLSCVLRNKYVRQEAVVLALYGTNDWFKIEGKKNGMTGVSALTLLV